MQLDGFEVGSRVMRKVTKARRPSRLPPGPPEHPIWQTVAWVRWPIRYLTEMRARYGRTFTMRLAVPASLVIFSEPDAVKDIFTGPPDDLYAGEANAVLEPILGKNSVLLLDGPRHMRERRLLLPPFHGERMQAYGETMRDATLTSMRRWPRGERFPLHEKTQEITLDVILRTVFGVEEGPRLEHLRGCLSRLLDRAQSPHILLPFFQVDLGRLSAFGRLLRELRDVDAAIYEEITRRRGTRAEGTDVLSMLLGARDDAGRAMTDTELRDELMTLLVAGHETTATTLAWAFRQLLFCPAPLARLRAEIDHAFPDGRVDPARAVTLPYLDAVVKEVLRVRPVVPMVGRRLQRPMRIGGFDLPAGVIAAPSIWLSHMNSDVWKDPESFRPERFLEEKPSPYAFFPFGGGVRRCIGMAFAMVETKIVLATILAGLEVRAADGYEPELVRRGITFAPSEGTPVVVRPR